MRLPSNRQANNYDGDSGKLSTSLLLPAEFREFFSPIAFKRTACIACVHVCVCATAPNRRKKLHSPSTALKAFIIRAWLRAGSGCLILLERQSAPASERGEKSENSPPPPPPQQQPSPNRHPSGVAAVRAADWLQTRPCGRHSITDRTANWSRLWQPQPLIDTHFAKSVLFTGLSQFGGGANFL